MAKRGDTNLELIDHVLANHQRLFGALTLALLSVKAPTSELDSMGEVGVEIESSLRGLRDELEARRKRGPSKT